MRVIWFPLLRYCCTQWTSDLLVWFNLNYFAMPINSNGIPVDELIGYAWLGFDGVCCILEWDYNVSLYLESTLLCLQVGEAIELHVYRRWFMVFKCRTCDAGFWLPSTTGKIIRSETTSRRSKYCQWNSKTSQFQTCRNINLATTCSGFGCHLIGER